MKKLSLVLLLALVALLALSACGQTAKTEIYARWFNDEHYEFAISKADFKTPAASGYALEYVPASEVKPDDMDEIVPEDIAGTYTMDVKVEGKNCTFTTTMEIISLYTDKYYNQTLPESIRADIESPDFQLKLSDEERDRWFGEGAEGVAIKSTTTTSVTFKNDETQRPINSQKETVGYYFGKQHQEVSRSAVTTKYNISKNKVTVTVDDHKAEERKVKFGKNSNVIDANQLLLYLRSLDKKQNSFQDSPSVQVYDPIYDTLRTASFTMVYQYKTFINCTYEQTIGEGDETQTITTTGPMKTKLTSVVATVDGQVFMVQMNLPASINAKNANLDVIMDTSTTYYKYTTVRFRVGYKCFELADYGELKDADGNKIGAKIVAALQKAA